MPVNEQYSPDYRDEAAGADNEGILPENRTEHPLSQAGSGYPFSSIVPKQTFCSYIPSQSVHRQSVHPIPERKREAGLPAERAAKYGRNQFVPPGAVSQMTFPG